MVRIHPGQLSRRRLATLFAVAWGCVIPLGLGGAPNPPARSAHWAVAASSTLAASSALATPPALPAPWAVEAPSAFAVPAVLVMPSVLAAPPAHSGSPASTALQRQPEQGPPIDSAGVRKEAEEAQARFERIRRDLLPYVWGGGSRQCDERIGRFCFWYDEDDDDWTPLPDSPDLVEARGDLLDTLAAAAHLLPADEWILGQRIRYMAEGGRWEEAARVARACGGADPWWCSVLQGFSLHGAGRYEAALERFHDGLEAMDPEEARRWRDPSVLLDGRGSDVLEDAADADADAESEASVVPAGAWEKVRTRVWTLADPLYLVSGNDRESEHYARLTFSKMHEGAQNAWRMRWGDDLEELTVRYGWDRGWERVRRDIRLTGGPLSVIGHQLPGGKGFTPPGRVLEVPSGTVPGAWVPDEKRPRSAHVPAYAPTLLPGVAQVAVFHRGDSILVAAATEVPARPDAVSAGPINWLPPRNDVLDEGPIAWPQPALLDGPEQTGLFLVDDGGRVSGTTGGLREGAFHLTVPAGRYLVSVEAWAPEDGLGGRVRHGITTEVIPDDLATLSDLILLSPGDSLPQALVSALPVMKSSTRLKPDSLIVLGWEVFGLGWRQEDVSFELSFYEEGESFFGRIGRWFGFGGREEPLRLEWSEPAPPDVGHWFRSVEVTIPMVNPGDYVFRLGITTPGREEMVRTRVVEIIE